MWAQILCYKNQEIHWYHCNPTFLWKINFRLVWRLISALIWNISGLWTCSDCRDYRIVISRFLAPYLHIYYLQAFTHVYWWQQVTHVIFVRYKFTYAPCIKLLHMQAEISIMRVNCFPSGSMIYRMTTFMVNLYWYQQTF